MKYLHFLLSICFLLCFSSCSHKKFDTTIAIEDINKSKTGEVSNKIQLSVREIPLSEFAEHFPINLPDYEENMKALGFQSIYKLDLNNVDPNKIFRLFERKSFIANKGEFYRRSDLSSDGDGKVSIKSYKSSRNKEKFLLKNNFIVAGQYLKGEILDFLVVSEDGEAYSSLRLCPNKGSHAL
jgi:hypothetical protein